jgi:hypothetical protein
MRWLPRFRFRLATLLAIVTAVCIALGLAVHRAQQKKAAVAHLEKLGAAVFFDYQQDAQGSFDQKAPAPQPLWAQSTLIEEYLRKALCLRLWDVRLTGAEMKAITALVDLETIEFYRCDFSAVGCERLAKLKKLKKLIMDQCDLGQTGLAPLGRLTNLIQLELNDTDLGEPGLPSLSRLASLEALRLRDTSVVPGQMEAIGLPPALEDLLIDGGAVNDDDLTHVAKLTSLKRLKIRHADLSDRAFAHFDQLTSLILLSLSDMQIEGDPDLEPLHQLTGLRMLELEIVESDKGNEALSRLRKALPNCQIFYQQRRVARR